MGYDIPLAHEEDYRGHRIEIHYDTDQYGRCPFDEWDGEPPIAVYTDRTITEYATQYGNVNTPPELTREQIRENLPDILALLGCNSVFVLRDLVYGWQDNIVDAVNQAISDYLDNLGNSDRLEALCELWKMTGVNAYVSPTYGYAQGDYAEVLVVATKEFLEATGAPNDENLENYVKLYGYWAWGDVFGYVIKDKDGETIDSLWGMYPNYEDLHTYQYALDEARNRVDWYIKHEIQQHEKQVKTWIKNKVPLYARTPLAI